MTAGISMELIRKAAAYIAARIKNVPETAIVLGSGLGGFAEKIENKKEIAYAEIPGFPVSGVIGHAGLLINGSVEGKYVICMSGRFHYYEGYSMKEIGFYVRVMKVLGVKRIIVTNAAGGINRCYAPGDLMLIRDHIKFFDDSPLRGENYGELGPRFNDMTACYDAELSAKALAAAEKLNIPMREGVYAFMSGPSFETPAEIRMLSILGADAVGMSTVPEVITAAHCGIKTLGISCITNMAAGILGTPLSHEEVFETANSVSKRFEALITEILKQL